MERRGGLEKAGGGEMGGLGVSFMDGFMDEWVMWSGVECDLCE